MAVPGRRRAAPSESRSERTAPTRVALVEAAIEALRDVGYAGASARAIAGRASCNQALVFYHFGSVTELLLAALDEVSDRRLAAYRELVERAGTLTDLVDLARTIFREDLASGHLAVLVEMVTGARSTPGLGAQVAERVAPWRDLAEEAVSRGLKGSPLATVVPRAELAHAVVAGFLGLELLADLDGEQEAALALFDRARQVAGLLDAMGAALPADPTEGT